MAGRYNVPYRTSLPDGFGVGTVMLVRGVVPRGADRFYINLLCNDEPESETVLHFNPRLDESTVVFNTLKCGEWGPEERGLGIPFQRGQQFHLLLVASRKGFKVRLCHRGGRQHPGLFPWQGQEGPWRRWGAKARPRLGRASPVPHLPWRKRTRGQAYGGGKDARARAQRVGVQRGGVDIPDPIPCPLASDVAALGQGNGWVGRQDPK
uniref:Galectin n=1 Tax=Balaenoptera musculus TaxID=9771 RepID=A0A8C0DGT6_BALMU